jgi:hypothetical protein
MLHLLNAVVGFIAGLLMGAAIYGQQYARNRFALIKINHSYKKKFILNCYRFGALIISLSVAFSIIYLIKVLKLRNGEWLDTIIFFGMLLVAFLITQKKLRKIFGECKNLIP